MAKRSTAELLKHFTDLGRRYHQAYNTGASGAELKRLGKARAAADRIVSNAQISDAHAEVNKRLAQLDKLRERYKAISAKQKKAAPPTRTQRAINKEAHEARRAMHDAKRKLPPGYAMVFGKLRKIGAAKPRKKLSRG